MGRNKMRRAIVLAISLAACVSTAETRAEDYPSRPVSLVVPSSAGSGLDVIARLVASGLSSRLGQPVIVDDRAGAGTALGSAFVASSAPNGYTLLFQSNALAALPVINKNVQFDPKKDFTYISSIATSAMALVVNPTSLPVKSLDDLASAARAQPGRLNYSSPGIGTQHHLAMEMLKQRLQLRIEHVPYRGGSGALNDLVAGQVQLAMSPINVVLQYVKSGQLALIAISGKNRSPLVPSVPTFEELGLQDLDIDIYFFIAAPAGLPAELIKRLSSELSTALSNPSEHEKLAALGLTPEPSSSEQLASKIGADVDRWRKFTADANIKSE
jgi:tripartite-type tricarboxylate transporter receptor subunit TctC